MAASGSDPHDVFEARSTERDNFYTLCTLLIDGGTRVFRDVLDHFLPPAELERELSDQMVRKTLPRSAKLTKKQCKILYPTPSTCGKSSDFDITMLFQILRFAVFQDEKLNNGWNELPPDKDHRPVADLVRIKFYRNELYAHAKDTKVYDEDFERYWNDASQALVRLEKMINSKNGEEWEKVISSYLESSQVTDCRRDVKELHQWCANDMQSEVIPEASAQYANRNEVEMFLSLEHPVNQRTESKEMQRFPSVSAYVGETIQSVPACHCLKGDDAMPVTHQNCTLEGSSVHEMVGDFSLDNNATVDRSISTVSNLSIESDTTVNRSISTVDGDDPSIPPDRRENYLVKEAMARVVINYLDTNPPTDPQEREDFESYLLRIKNIITSDAREKCLAIRLRFLSLEILQALWEDYNGENSIKKKAEECLVTDEITREFGVDKFGLKVKISEDEYKACRRKLILRELKTFNLGRIKKIEKLMDDGSFQDALALIKEFNPSASVGTPAILEGFMQDEQVIDLSNKFGQSPLHIAAVHGNTAVAVSLLLRGADASKTDMFGRTPLHIASWHGHVDFVRALMDCRPKLDLDYQDEFGKTALNKATQKGHIAVSIILQRCGAKPLFHVPSLRLLSCEGLTKIHNGSSQFHQLCKEGRYREIKRLILSHSIRTDVIEGCQTSVDATEFPDMSASEIVGALEGAGYKQIARDFEEAKKRYAHMPRLHEAVESCDIDEVAALLLDITVPVNKKAGNDETALHLACATGHSKITAVLLDFDANLNAQTTIGMTPLMIASALQNYSCVNLLLEKGANVEAQNGEGYTVLHQTARKGDSYMLKQLLPETKPPNLECTDPYGKTPLHLAAEYGRVEAAAILLREGADPNARSKQCLRDRIYMVQGKSDSQDIWMYVLIHKHVLELWEKEHRGPQGVRVSEFGEVLLAGAEKLPPKRLKRELEGKRWAFDVKDETPLMLAVRNGNEDIVRLLLKNNADIGLSDAENLSALHMAAIKGNKPISKFLVDEGADIKALSSELTPLALAERNHNSEVASYLQSLNEAETKEPQPRELDRIPVVYPEMEVFLKQLIIEQMYRTAGQLYDVTSATIYVSASYRLADRDPAAVAPTPMMQPSAQTVC